MCSSHKDKKDLMWNVPLDSGGEFHEEEREECGVNIESEY